MIKALSGWSQHIPPKNECSKYGKECQMMMPPLIHIEISKAIEHGNNDENIEREDDNNVGCKCC